MTESRTNRMAGLPQWDNKATDSPTMEDFNEAFLDINQNGAMFLQGTLAARPAAGTSGRFYFVTGDTTTTNNGQLYYDDGSAWTMVVDPQQRAVLNAQANPIGVIELFAGTTAPTGWLFCQGQSVSTATYPDLFAVLQYTFGGSGSTFGVPDLRDRVPTGAGNLALGAKGGATTVTLAIGNMPNHSHDLANHTHTIAHGHTASTDAQGSHQHYIDHTHSFPYTSNSNTTVSGNANRVQNFGGGSSQGTYGASAAYSDWQGSHGHNIAVSGSNTGSSGGPSSNTTSPQGSGTAFNIQNPYLALNYIIKAVPVT